MVWASSTRVAVHAASEGNSASVPVGSAPGEPPGFIGVAFPSTRHVWCPEPDPHALGLAVPGSWGEQPLARTLERAVGMQIMVERAGWEVAELAADVGNRAVLVGHETLGVALLLRGDDAGTSPFVPRARAAFTPSRTRWRMTLRSISANVVWICKVARPAGVVVSMGELKARNPLSRSLSSLMRVMSSPARRRTRSRSKTTRESPRRR